MVNKITCNLMSIRFLFYTLVNNFDSGVFCYLHRGNPIYSGPFLLLQNVLECSLQSYDSKTQSFNAPAIKILCFPVRKQHVLLHLFSFLLEVATNLVTNPKFSAETTSHSLLFVNDLLTTMPAARYMKIEPAIV